MTRPKPLVLIILDGWGYRAETKANAIALARKPTYDRLLREYPNTLIHTSGGFVGLPDGQMGNSEVGHLNIGAGRIVDQDIVRISKAVKQHDLTANPIFVEAVRGKNVHFAGLLSDGGVHSLQGHLHGMIDEALALGAKNVYVHALLDGRDTPPRSAERYLRELLAHIEGKNAHLATIIGRYFTMD